MRIRWGVASMALAAGLAAGQAWAVDRPSAYVAIGAGVDFMRDMDFTGIAPLTGSLDSDIGWGAIGAIGYRWAQWGLRTEIEGGYRRSGSDFAPGATDGDVTLASAMFNVLFDFAREQSALTPYLGGGAGFMHGDFDFEPVGASDVMAFAYQGIAGLSYALGARSELFADYRYLATSGLRARLGDFVNDDELRSHSVMAGLRWSFWAPAAAPAPAAVPAPAPVVAQPREFIIYYEFDKADITEAAGAVLDEIKTYTTPGANPVDVVGHTDTSGSPAYNESLSERRAGAAADGLRVRGVTVDSVTWRGEAEPAVQSGDGVKEPLNRRSVISVKGPQPGDAAAPADQAPTP